MQFLRLFSLSLALFLSVFSAASGAQDKNQYLLVLNQDDSTLTILSPTDLKVLGKVAVGDSPHEVIASQDGKTAYITNYGAKTPGSSLSVVDLASMKETRRVDLSPLMRPHGLLEIGGKIYFTAEVNRLIARYDPATNKVDWIMGTGQNGSHMVVGTSDQKRFYTTNVGSDSVTAFEFANIPPAGSKITQIAVGKQPEAIDLSPDGKEVWVGLNVDGAIDIIDTAQNKAVEKIKLGERPYRVKFTPDGKQLYATMPNTKELVVIDAATRKEVKRIKLESSPLGIIFSKDGKLAFVSAVQSDFVFKIDIEKGEMTAKMETGKAPDGIFLAGM